MNDAEGLGQKYASARPHMDAALVEYQEALGEVLAGRISDFYVVGRVKTARSLIRKLRKEPSSPRSWESVQDKVGIRAICSTKADLRSADAAIASGPWEVVDREVKTGDHDRLFYPGVHFIVDNHSSTDHLGSPILAEIQVRTRAQDAWSVVSHKLLYKGLIEPPNRMKRVIARLTVVVEMFDDEVHRMIKRRKRLPVYRPAMMLEALDLEFERLVGEPSRSLPDLDLMFILLNAYTEEEKGAFEIILTDFCASNATSIAASLAEHQPSSVAYLDSKDWFFSQPEVLMVIERAHARPFMLTEAIRDTDIEDVVRNTCVSLGKTLPAA